MKIELLNKSLFDLSGAKQILPTPDNMDLLFGKINEIINYTRKEDYDAGERDDIVVSEVRTEQLADQRILTAEITSANIIRVQLRHSGYKGGDSGHGGFVEIMIEDLASTDMQVNGEESRLLYLRFGGDTERDTLLRALKIITKELEENQYF